MADDIYTTRENGIPRETTIIHERGSGAGWVVALALVLALILGIWYFGNLHDSRVSRDNAITSAANSVSDAAHDVGNSARKAADDAAN